MHTEITLIGAGGHAKVVADSLLKSNPEIKITIVDQDVAKLGQAFMGISEIESLSVIAEGDGCFHVSIGNNQHRMKHIRQLISDEKCLVSIVHPTAALAATSHIGEGGFVAAGAVLGPDSSLATGVIVNHGAVVDHDCEVGAFSHIAPNATLGGSARIGSECLIGAGAVILPGVQIADRAIIGAGAVVLKDVPAGSIVTGVPGRMK